MPSLAWWPLMPRRLTVNVTGSVALYHGVPDVDRGGFREPEHLGELGRVPGRRVVDGRGELVQAHLRRGRGHLERVAERQRGDRADDGDDRGPGDEPGHRAYTVHVVAV